MVNLQKLKTMKKYYAIFAAVLFLAAPSCTKQEKSVDTPDGEITLETISLTAGKEARDIPVAPQSKAFIDGTAVLWESTDQVRIYDDVAPATPHDFSVTPSDPASSAELSGQVAEGSSHFHAVSPAAAGVSISGSDITLSLPAAQVIPAGKNVSSEALLSVASADRGNALEFKNVCGFLKVEVSYKNVKSITVTGEKIAGTATVDAATGQIKDNSSATGSVTVTYAEGEVFPTGVYYIAVLPGTTPAGGFTVSLTQDIAGFSATKTATQAVPIARNGGFDFAKLDTTIAWEYLISNADELVAWNARYAEWKATDKVYLTADIDMTGHSGWVGHDFSGTFDGLDRGDNTTIHKIYNFVVENTDGQSCFIGALSGTLKNLIIGSSDGITKDGISKFHVTSSKQTSYIFPSLVRATTANTDASMENVSNFAQVKLDGTDFRMLRAAGICAQWSSNGDCVNCNNYGDVEIASDVKPAEDADHSSTKTGGTIAGIISFANKPVGITGCNNYGKITANSNYLYRVGGVLGYPTAAIEISNCSNYGDIVCKGAPTVSELNIGGIASSIGNANAKILESENHGEVCHSISSNTSKTTNIGGIVGYSNNGTIENCENYSKIYTDGTASYGANIFIGGIIGYCQNNKVIVTGCHNKKGTYANNVAYEGKIECNRPTTTNKSMMFGGVCGYVQASAGTGAEFTDCHNQASVESNANILGYTYYGGVVGYFDNVKTGGAIKNCSNSGSITNNGTVSTANYVRIGGILGCGRLSPNLCIDGCTSTGVFSNTNSSVTVNLPIGGIVGFFNSTTQILNSKVDANISTSGTAKLLGAIAGTVGVDCTIENNGVRGSVDGVALTADNWSEKLWPTTSKTVTTNTPNYYWNGE